MQLEWWTRIMQWIISLRWSMPKRSNKGKTPQTAIIQKLIAYSEFLKIDNFVVFWKKYPRAKNFCASVFRPVTTNESQTLENN